MDAFRKSYSKGTKGCGNPLCIWCGSYGKKDKKLLRRLGRRRVNRVKSNG